MITTPTPSVKPGYFHYWHLKSSEVIQPPSLTAAARRCCGNAPPVIHGWNLSPVGLGDMDAPTAQVNGSFVVSTI
jgi:hypothetical protein